MPGEAWLTLAESLNWMPFLARLDWKMRPTWGPITRSMGADSMPTIVTLWSFERALPTSIPMKELPIMTMFFLSVAAARMACTSWIVRRVKMLDSSPLKPGRGRVRGIPPVARTSLV